jgi:hypothetical protein
MKTPLFILIIFSVVQISCSNQNFDIIIDNKRNETTVNTSKTDPLSPAQCDPLKILFQNGVN